MGNVYNVGVAVKILDVEHVIRLNGRDSIDVKLGVFVEQPGENADDSRNEYYSVNISTPSAIGRRHGRICTNKRPSGVEPASQN